MSPGPPVRTTRGDLRLFSQTAQHPSLRGLSRAGPDPRFAATGMVPAYRARRARQPPPPGYRLAVGIEVGLIALGLLGLVVHHLRPSALSPIESAAAARGAPSSPGHRSSAAATTPVRRSGRGVITEAATGTGTGTVSVRASAYDVLVATQGACWVEVTEPGAAAAVFGQTMAAGAQQVFAATSKGLVVNLGSAKVVLSVQIGGKTVAGWTFTPTTAPFTLTFASA